jgi:hypothetical protein
VLWFHSRPQLFAADHAITVSINGSQNGVGFFFASQPHEPAISNIRIVLGRNRPDLAVIVLDLAVTAHPDLLVVKFQVQKGMEETQ